jgi:predicted DCC family thiol-disulfide oxidoreductase YuxK
MLQTSKLSSNKGFILLYDSDCGVCSRFKKMVELLDWDRRIDYLSLTDLKTNEILSHIPKELRLSSSHLVLPDGSVLTGSDYLSELFEILPLTRYTLKLFARFPYILFFWVFLFDVISRLHGTSFCKASI